MLIGGRIRDFYYVENDFIISESIQNNCFILVSRIWKLIIIFLEKKLNILLYR